MKKWGLNLVLTLSTGVVGLGVMSPIAFASSYNGSAAAAYADQYAINGNTAYPIYSDDCTNYVSQALAAGGFPEVVDYNLNTGMPIQTSDNRYWFYQDGVRSYSWSVAEDLRLHLAGYTSYTHMYHYYGLQGSGTYNALSYGDPIAYNWNSPSDSCWSQGAGTACHWSIDTSIGTDPKGYTGDLADEHTNNRYHVFWSLEDYNPYAATTDIYGYHITY